MLLLRPPTETMLRSFLEQQAQLPLSHPYQQATDNWRLSGFDSDCSGIHLGTSAHRFEAACNALRQWRQFPRPWTRIFPANAPLSLGNHVAIIARTFGIWSLNACRIVEVIEDHSPRRFGLVYATLPDHVECGAERFMIEWRDDDSVWYEVRAVSRPRHPLARLAYPLVRRLQRRFARESLQAMKQAVEESI